MIPYYQELLNRGRLIPILDIRNNVIGAFNFYIVNVDNKYLYSDDFKIIEDDVDGNICFIDHLFMDRKKNHADIAHVVFTNIIKLIKEQYPQIEYLKWCRYKDGRRYIFSKYIGGIRCHTH